MMKIFDRTFFFFFFIKQILLNRFARFDIKIPFRWIRQRFAAHRRGQWRANGFFASARINLWVAGGDGARWPRQSGDRRCSQRICMPRHARQESASLAPLVKLLLVQRRNLTARERPTFTRLTRDAGSLTSPMGCTSPRGIDPPRIFPGISRDARSFSRIVKINHNSFTNVEELLDEETQNLRRAMFS